MGKLHYTVVVRNSKGKHYKDSNGNNVVRFQHESAEYKDADIIKGICRSLYNDYKAIAKRGSSVDIEVSYHNTISGTYPSLYAYRSDKTFIKFT
jgi:hypothetical protein